MRDNLCDKENLIEEMNFRKEWIEENILKLQQLEQDKKNNIQRFSGTNDEIIYNYTNDNIRNYLNLINASYSYGLECREIDEYYQKSLEYFEAVGTKFGLYIEFIQYFALGLILEMPKDRMQKIVDTADKNEYNDILFDFYAESYGLKRKFKSTEMLREVPYKGILEIAGLAKKDRQKAEKKLSEYILKKWIKGHADEGWPSVHKKKWYIGLWSFDAGLLAKIFGLDDSALKDNNHYPYDLVHYKNNVVFEDTEVPQLKEDDGEYEIGIAENPELENLIAPKFHKTVNQLIVDFKTLGDKAIFEKYNLVQIWGDFESYEEYDKENVLGFLILSILVREQYVMQLDWKENIRDFKQYMKSYWGKTKTKLVSFKVDNDQQYFALLPKDCDVKNLYEIEIK